MSGETQAANAIKFYEAKSGNYDDSWHSDFTQRFVSYLDLQAGQTVLDLACGTGLLTFLEAEAVGPSGNVIGVDVTPSMLAIAAHKKDHGGEKYENINFHRGNVLHLDELKDLDGKTFDVITVASALVLFPDPKGAIEHWSKYLKPGGILVVDATHPRNLVAGMVLERVARRLNLPIPYNRSWSKSEMALKKMLESAGLKVEKVVTVDHQAGYGRRTYDVDQWDDFFVENVIVKDVTRIFANNDIRKKAQAVYKEEWEKLAIDGKVEEVDSVFLGIAKKATDGSRYVPPATGEEVVFKGGCRCGGVQYESTSPPADFTLCFCRACQQLSGTAYLPYADVPKAALKYTTSATLTRIRLTEFAERTLCSACGSPLTMAYIFNDEHFSDDHISITMGSVYPESMTCDYPRVKQHIYLNEKAPWVTPPDDGADRWGTWEHAHRVV